MVPRHPILRVFPVVLSFVQGEGIANQIHSLQNPTLKMFWNKIIPVETLVRNFLVNLVSVFSLLLFLLFFRFKISRAGKNVFVATTSQCKMKQEFISNSFFSQFYGDKRAKHDESLKRPENFKE